MSKTYSGGCHCGEVRFEVTTDLDKVIACNCSICQKRGALWTFVAPEQFALRAGSEDLKDYQFGKKLIHHLFCAQCGVGAFSRGTAPDGKEAVAVNVRCLDNMDIGSLQLMPFDGRSM
ncbi:MAG: GFA family protein [Xanthobacteraceae bacterium]